MARAMASARFCKSIFRSTARPSLKTRPKSNSSRRTVAIMNTVIAPSSPRGSPRRDGTRRSRLGLVGDSQRSRAIERLLWCQMDRRHNRPGPLAGFGIDRIGEQITNDLEPEWISIHDSRVEARPGDLRQVDGRRAGGAEVLGDQVG